MIIEDKNGNTIMDYYFLIITIIDVFVLGIMCVLTKDSETLNVQKKIGFIQSFLLIIIISILEIITIIVDNKAPSFRWINIIANYLGFGLTPAVPIFLSSTLENQRQNRTLKWAKIIEAGYLLFLAVTFPFKTIFYVDQNNHYVRGNLFVIYLLMYIAAILYLLFVTMKVAVIYQDKSKNSIFSIAAFLVLGSMIQVFFPHVHVTWLCVTLLSLLYYIYCSGMWQQLDELTGLLNQKSYLNKTAVLSQNGTLVVFDVDDFKQINDNYGHLMGDKCLKEIAACIKNAYSRDGFCYRIGGDEFCVILHERSDKDRCYRRLLKEWKNRKRSLKILPHISIGTASFKAGDNAQKVKETADQDLYRFKTNQKKERKLRERIYSSKY